MKSVGKRRIRFHRSATRLRGHLARLIVLCFPVLIASPALRSQPLFDRSYAVVIGINIYQNPHWHALPNAAGDAQAMASLLNNEGFQVFELYNLNATKQAILQVMQNTLAPRLGPRDRVLVFFAGHGYTETLGGDEKGYIIPADATDASATFISVDNLREQSANMKNARHQLFLMDSCFGGLFAVTRGVQVSRSAPNYIQELASRPGREILTAGGHNQEVLDGSPGGHSPFVTALLSGLRDGLADQDGDGYITFSELSNFVTSAASNAYQTPTVSVMPGHMGGEFLFVSPRGRTGASLQASPLPSTVTRGLDSSQPPFEPKKPRTKRVASAMPKGGGVFAPPAPSIRLLNVGDAVPGTAWQFGGFGMFESGVNASAQATMVPPQFGSNSRFLYWSFNVNAPANSGGTAPLACDYLDGAGRQLGEMSQPLNIPAQAGGYFVSQGWGSATGTTWGPGLYAARCTVNGVVVVNVNFRVVEAAIFHLNRRGKSNVPLLIITEGDHGRADSYAGELWASPGGIEWHDFQKTDANFQSPCADMYIVPGKDNRVTIHHGRQTSEFYSDDPQFVVNGVNRACGR
jgi:hypothetical protein